MRFADSNVLTVEEAAQVPPLEVRLGLEAGDRVALYELVRHSSMGEGVSPIQATVLGSHELGWFIGETDDGAEIEFNADQVLDVEVGSPAMGGFLDWFRELAAQAPGKGGVQLPMLPQPKKPSFFQALKQAAAGLPIERPSSVISPQLERPGFLSILKKALTPFTDVVRMVREEAPPKKEVKPVDPTKLDIFEFVSPKALAAFSDIEIVPRETVIPKHLEPEIKEYTKVLPLPPRNTVFPTVEEVARGLMTYYDIEDLFDKVRQVKKEEWWQEDLEREGIAKWPFETIGRGSGVRPTPEEEMAAFLNIPWSEFIKRSEIETYEWGGKVHESREFTEDVTTELLYPSADLIHAAFELIKPSDLPGFFALSWEEDLEGMGAILYAEESPEVLEKIRSGWEFEEEEEGEAGEEIVEEEVEEEVKKAPEKKEKKKKSKKGK